MMSHSTQTIHAAYNLAIELEPGRWRLLNGAHNPDTPEALPALLEAQPGGIVCAPTFARARRLPPDGHLAPSDVARVVVGWAPESRNWHLGLMLLPGPGDADRLRWCGLAHWPSGPAGEYERQAAEAGRALAAVIGRPFHVVPPPQPTPAPAQKPLAPVVAGLGVESTTRHPAFVPPAIEDPARAPEPDSPALAPTLPPTLPPAAPAPGVALQTPPFRFESWRMVATRRGYTFQRPTRWVLALMLRAGGYMVGALVFIMLSIGSLESGLAQVEPAWLPYVGMGVGAVLGLLALVTWGRVLTVADVVIDTQRREVRRRNRFNGIVRWRVPFDAVEYVLLTQTPARARGRKQADRPVTIWLTAWLHLYDGRRFWTVAELGQVEGKSHAWPLVEQQQKQRGRRALSLAHYDTPAHHAAQFAAGALAAEVWVDIV